MQNNFDHCRILRECISLKLDTHCGLHDQLASDNPERSQLLRQIEALNKAYCATQTLTPVQMSGRSNFVDIECR